MTTSVLYFAPCEPNQGMSGGGRLGNMLNALESLRIKTHLIVYLPKEKFRLAHRQISCFSSINVVFVNRKMPKLFKAVALIPILIYGVRHARKCSIIFAHAPTIITGFPALLLAKIIRKPLIIDHMDIKDPHTPTFIYNLILKNSDMVLVISRYLKREAIEIGCKNVVYLPNFVDVNMFKNDQIARNEIRKKLGINEGVIVIGYAGSFSHGEGLTFMLRAFKKISDKYENVKFIVIGGRNVPDSDDVPQLIEKLKLKDKVLLVPPQPHDAVPKYLSACDILCSFQIDCTVNRAAAPIKIYEYMAMGMPVIASRIGEIQYVIEDGVDGFLVKPNDEKNLEKVMEHTIRNLEKLKSMGDMARRKIIKNYSKEVFLSKIRSIIEMCGG